MKGRLGKVCLGNRLIFIKSWRVLFCNVCLLICVLMKWERSFELISKLFASASCLEWVIPPLIKCVTWSRRVASRDYPNLTGLSMHQFVMASNDFFEGQQSVILCTTKSQKMYKEDMQSTKEINPARNSDTPEFNLASLTAMECKRVGISRIWEVWD